jgi:DnaJ family protein A protein 5
VADSSEPQVSKRDKRRAREAKKKAEEEAQKAAMKEARKAAKKAPREPEPAPKSTAKNGFTPAKKGKKPPPEVVTEEKIAEAIKSIEQKQAKLAEKWAEVWDGELGVSAANADLVARIPFEQAPVLCLGLGKAYSDRTAQIQLALLVQLVARFKVGVRRRD